MNTFLILFASASLLSAWYLGYRSHQSQGKDKKVKLPRDYLMGLNFLLNEEPDKAVDVFIKMLEVDSSTVETHLAVGKLFRKRGEVDRAIRIHQNLIARPELEKIYHNQALYELGQDYLSAGVLDRAERIFLELADIKPFATTALKALLDIYQQEKSWGKAIQIAQKLQKVSNSNMQSTVAHYYCELAESAFKENQIEEATRLLKEAMNSDRHCVRASLLQARLNMSKNDYKSALHNLKRIKKQNPDYFSEAISYLATCYEALNQEEKLITYLTEVLEEHPQIPIALILCERMRKWKGNKIATDFMAEYIRRFPSLIGLRLFINLFVSNLEGHVKEDLLVLQTLMNKLLSETWAYRCHLCGFSGESLHWQCPGCKQWNSVRPIVTQGSR